MAIQQGGGKKGRSYRGNAKGVSRLGDLADDATSDATLRRADSRLEGRAGIF